MNHIRAILFGACVATWSIAATAQTEKYKAADTSSPRDTLRSFIEACNELHALIEESRSIDRSRRDVRELGRRILDCLDVRDLPAFARDERAGEVAAALKEIIDRVEIPPWDEIPDAIEIQKAGGYEMLSRWRIPDTRITIERADEGAQKHEYLFSRGTIDRAVEYFETIEHRPYRETEPETSPNFYNWYISAPGSPLLGSIVDRLPERFRFGRTFGLANWKWPGVLLMLAVALAAMRGLYSLQSSVGSRVPPEKRLRYFLVLVFPLAAMLVPIAYVMFSMRIMTVRSDPLYVISFVAYAVAMVCAIVLIFAASNRVAESIIASPKINESGLNAQLIRILSKLVAILLAVVVLITGGQYLGIPIATLLASAGIGGIAVALGAQDTLRNIFATIALMGDKPCRVGDMIEFGEYQGIVEDIGLRSTKLRLLEGHLVTIPNDQLAGKDVENISRRKRIRRSAALHIPLDTPCAQVERALAILRELLADHEGMESNYPPRVYFEEFDQQAFRIRFIYWYSPADFWEFKAFGERLNLEIFRAFEAEQIQFSLPFRHSYWKHDNEQGPLQVELEGR